jgi:hypothetical protein
MLKEPILHIAIYSVLTSASITLGKHPFMRRTVNGRRRRSTVHLTHPLTLRFLKHLVFFSVDPVENDGGCARKRWTPSPANVPQRYILSIEEV